MVSSENASFLSALTFYPYEAITHTELLETCSFYFFSDSLLFTWWVFRRVCYKLVVLWENIKNIKWSWRAEGKFKQLRFSGVSSGVWKKKREEEKEEQQLEQQQQQRLEHQEQVQVQEKEEQQQQHQQV